MIEIKTKKRVFVQKIGVVEAGETTPAEDENAVYLVDSKQAEYANEDAAKAGAKVKAAMAKAQEAES